MELLYEELCLAGNTKPEEDYGRVLRKDVPRILGKTETFGDAREALGLLKANGRRLILLTKGETTVQERRIRESGLETLFERVRIVPHKTTREFHELLEQSGVPAANSWSIGNSARSDINPATAIGMRGVLIPRGTWSYEVETLADGNAVVANSLREAAEKVLGAGSVTAAA
jgi:putative hydrolase of the HAD superfamily